MKEEVERQLRPTGIWFIGRAAVPRRQRSGNSALPILAERQLRPTDEKNGGNKKAPDCSGALMKTN
jgi:hypothetical protein